MRTRYGKKLGFSVAGGLLAAGVLGGVTAAFSAQAPTPAAESNAPPAAIRYSPGMTDILKMVDGKVDAEVIKAYIKNSAVAYDLSVPEIIALKDRGVRDDIVAALLQRGAEARAARGIGAQATAPPSPGPPAPYAPAPGYNDGYDYGAGVVSPDYGYGYPYYAYGYPYNYWWWDYPVVYGGFILDSFGHRHFRGDRFERSHHFAYGRNGFAAGSRAPFATFRGNFNSRGSRAGFAAPRAGFAGRAALGPARTGGFGGHGMGMGRGR